MEHDRKDGDLDAAIIQKIGPPPEMPSPSSDIRDAFRRVFDTPDGKIVLGFLLKNCGYSEPSIASSDPYATAFKDGAKQSVRGILFLLSDTSDETFAYKTLTDFFHRYPYGLNRGPSA